MCLRTDGRLPQAYLGCFMGAGTTKSPGQATVEGAFLIPVILLLLLLLIQPGILLFDRTVMNAAAAEGCRLLATRTVDMTDSSIEEYLRRRLSAIPQQENFHQHEAGCSWEFELSGDEGSREVSVRIGHRVRPLPFLDFATKTLGLVGQDGAFHLEVEASQAVRSDWVVSNDEGLDPSSWVAREGRS